MGGRARWEGWKHRRIVLANPKAAWCKGPQSCDLRAGRTPWCFATLTGMPCKRKDQTPPIGQPADRRRPRRRFPSPGRLPALAGIPRGVGKPRRPNRASSPNPRARLTFRPLSLPGATPPVSLDYLALPTARTTASGVTRRRPPGARTYSILGERQSQKRRVDGFPDGRAAEVRGKKSAWIGPELPPSRARRRPFRLTSANRAMKRGMPPSMRASSL